MAANRKRTPEVKFDRVKFTPEEMAYDPPPEETENWAYVGRGPAALFAKPPRRTTVTLDPDVAAFFGDARKVNETLRKTMELMMLKPTTRKKKTA